MFKALMELFVEFVFAVTHSIWFCVARGAMYACGAAVFLKVLSWFGWEILWR